MPIITTVLAIAGAGASVAAGVSIGQLYRNYNPSKKKITSDLQKLIQEVDSLKEGLIPVKKEDLEILSYTQTKNEIKKGAITTAKGIFNSIYHEPMVVYSYKRYFSSENKNVLLYASTSKLKLVYRTKDGTTTIAANNKPLGELTSEGLFYSAKRKRQVASIEKKLSAETFPVFINEKEVASIDNPYHDNVNPNPRVFSLISSELNDAEAILLLSIAILEMIEAGISK